MEKLEELLDRVHSKEIYEVCIKVRSAVFGEGKTFDVLLECSRLGIQHAEIRADVDCHQLSDSINMLAGRAVAAFDGEQKPPCPSL